MKKLVIILPTYNERKNLAQMFKDIFAQEALVNGWKFEILVVDDERSSDGTFDFVQKLKNPKVHIMTVPPGLGTALIKGHQYSIAHLKPDALAQLDADGQVGAEVLQRMVESLDQEYT